jgi:hypothetical protein
MNTVLYLKNLYKTKEKCVKKIDKNFINFTDNNFINLINLDERELKSFKDYVINNVDRLVYNYGLSGYKKMEKEISLKKNDIKMNEIELRRLFLAKKNLDIFYNFQNDKYIKRTDIYAKSKTKNNKEEEEPSKNRYIFNHSKYIKILDKMWLMEISDRLGKDVSNLLIKDMFYINSNIKTLAVKITNKTKNILLLDLKKAFDSVEFNTIRILLGRFLKRNVRYYYKYLEQYMSLLVNRNCYYKKNKIKVNKGIPTGLPSSNLVFSIILNEIFLELFGMFNYLEYFNFYIYVDDICIELKEEENKYLILLLINDLKKLLSKYKLVLNDSKCKMSYNLKGILDFGIIDNKDLYLGIPFERRKKRYMRIILDIYNKKNDMELGMNEFIKSDDPKIKGYLRYKVINV